MEGVASASQQRLDFMKLLVAEMQNQNPLEPMDNQQMSAQLAQFSQLEQSELMNKNLETMNGTVGKMNSSFQAAMLVAEVDYARSLLGQEVTFYNADREQTLRGKVEEVRFADGHPVLSVQAKVAGSGGALEDRDFVVAIDDVRSIGNWQEVTTIGRISRRGLPF